MKCLTLPALNIGDRRYPGHFDRSVVVENLVAGYLLPTATEFAGPPMRTARRA